jgi:hypothetical protein
MRKAIGHVGADRRLDRLFLAEYRHCHRRQHPSVSDRFLLGTLGNAEMLGIYAVAYSLVDRPISLI